MKNRLNALVDHLRPVAMFLFAAALLSACGGGSSDQGLNQVAGAQGTPDSIVQTAAASAPIRFVASTGAIAQTYTFAFLDTPAGWKSYAADINNSGKIVGASYDPGNVTWYATLWVGTTTTYLGALSGRGDSFANGINASGQVAGSGITGTPSQTNPTRAKLWNGTTPTDLGPGNATGINDAGQVVGFGTLHGRFWAILWNGTTRTALGTLGGTSGTYTIARDINNSGQIVGTSSLANGTIRAALWNGLAPTDLGTLGGSSSEAYAINDAGQVVGASHITGNADTHATLWNGTTPTDLGTLSGTYSMAQDINASGQIVGHGSTSVGGYQHAILWNGSSIIDLNRFLDGLDVSNGWVLSSANGINDNGWIVGGAINSFTGEYRAYLLTPTPLTDKAQCKNDGWQNFGFQNQGQCIQFVNTGN